MTSPYQPLVAPPVAPVTTVNPGAGAGGAVTPDDSTIFPWPTTALWVGVTGDLVLNMGGNIVTLSNVPVGLYAIACVQVMAATTADGIVALN